MVDVEPDGFAVRAVLDTPGGGKGIEEMNPATATPLRRQRAPDGSADVAIGDSDPYPPPVAVDHDIEGGPGVPHGVRDHLGDQQHRHLAG